MSESTIDTYGVKNVNFSLIKESDPRFDAFKKQRQDRGFDDSELWSFDCTIAGFITPRLKAFRDHAVEIGDHPGSMDYQKWIKILDDMIAGFEIYPEHFNWKQEEQEANWKKVNKALSLFTKYFYSLWN